MAGSSWVISEQLFLKFWLGGWWHQKIQRQDHTPCILMRLRHVLDRTVYSVPCLKPLNLLEKVHLKFHEIAVICLSFCHIKVLYYGLLKRGQPGNAVANLSTLLWWTIFNSSLFCLWVTWVQIVKPCIVSAGNWVAGFVCAGFLLPEWIQLSAYIIWNYDNGLYHGNGTISKLIPKLQRSSLHSHAYYKKLNLMRLRQVRGQFLSSTRR